MLTLDSNFAVKNFLSALDYTVLVVIIALHALVILYSQRKQHQNTHKHLAIGQKFTLTLFVTSLTVAWYGKFFYVTQTAFENGLYNFYTQGIFWYVAYALFAFYLIRRIRVYNAVSLTALIRKMYGDKSTNIAAVLVVIKAMPITYLLSLMLVLHMFMNISMWTIALLVLSWLIFSTINDDTRTDMYSNVIHFICVLAAVGSVLIFAAIKWGGLSFLYANLPASYFQPHGTHSSIDMLAWFGLAISTTFISPIFYQYCLAADSERTAKVGVIICIVFWILIDICTTSGAMYAKAIFPNAEPLSAYGMLVSSILPDGLRGLFVAGIIGTMTPTISTCISIIKATIHDELLGITHQSKSNIFGVILSVTLLLMVLFNNAFDSILIVKNCFAGFLFIPIVIGFYAPGIITSGVLFLSIITSGMAMGIWYISDMQSILKIDLIAIGCAASFLVFAYSYYRANTNKLCNNIFLEN